MFVPKEQYKMNLLEKKVTLIKIQRKDVIRSNNRHFIMLEQVSLFVELVIFLCWEPLNREYFKPLEDDFKKSTKSIIKAFIHKLI